jgi:hypothetical protein
VLEFRDTNNHNMKRVDKVKTRVYRNYMLDSFITLIGNNKGSS